MAVLRLRSRIWVEVGVGVEAGAGAGAVAEAESGDEGVALKIINLLRCPLMNLTRTWITIML